MAKSGEKKKILFRKVMTVNQEEEGWNWLNWGPGRLTKKIRRKF